MKVLEREVFQLTILKVLKGPLADTLEVHRRMEEITHTKDLHAHAATTTPFEVMTAFDFLSSVESWDYNYLPYPRLTSAWWKQKFSPPWYGHIYFSAIFTGAAVAQMKLRRSSVAWMASVIAKAEKRRHSSSIFVIVGTVIVLLSRPNLDEKQPAYKAPANYLVASPRK